MFANVSARSLITGFNGSATTGNVNHVISGGSKLFHRPFGVIINSVGLAGRKALEASVLISGDT